MRLLLLACAAIPPIRQAALLARADIHHDPRLALVKSGKFYAATLSGAVTLDATYPEICKLNTDGTERVVTLDSETLSIGLYRRIINSSSGAVNLVVKDADANTIGTINQNEQGEFINEAGVWTLIAISAIALS